MKIVAFGDSTTAVRPIEVKLVYSQRLQNMLHDTGLNIEIINSGIPGNTTADARKRFESDVLSHDPDMAIMQFGINDSAVDVWKNETEPRVMQETFKENLCYFIVALRKRSIPVIIMTPNPLCWTEPLLGCYGKPPYDRDDPDGFNLLLRYYAETVREISSEQEIPLVDIYRIFKSMDIKRLLLDGMHPNDEGHTLVAAKLFNPVIANLKV